MMTLLEHRMVEVEKDLAKLQADHETRLRALEIAVARMVAWAAGGAFCGGLVWNLVSRWVA